MEDYPTIVINSDKNIRDLPDRCSRLIVDEFVKNNNERTVPTDWEYMEGRRKVLREKIEELIENIMK